MQRIRAGNLRRRDQPRDVEIRLAARRRPDADIVIGKADMQRFPIGLAEDGHGMDAEFATGADDPKGNLAPIGNEDFIEHAS